MKKILASLLLILSGCNPTTYKSKASTFLTLGSKNGYQTWLYLCGMLTDFLPQYMDELNVLDTIGKELNIKILAVIPQRRCPNLDNRLCWPQDNKEETLRTYKEIIDSIHQQIIDGYIGFSNGGFFFTQLAQYITIHKPIIAIGSAGNIYNSQGPHNNIHLLIGKKDQWHYEHAINLYNQSKNTNLTIDLFEYDGGHEIPLDELKNVLENFL